ncbi:RecX family transcriptional regulator [Candidatus Acetothermia bacterium]|nr:RecX family transcriptional regulator [Candidatus Acetothermia bacterium]
MILLRHRPRSKAEARERLYQRGYSEEEISAVLKRAVEERLIDDQLFARLWVEEKIAHDPLSRRALAIQLQEKGIPTEISDAILSELYPLTLEEQLVSRLINKRLLRYQRLSIEQAERRLINFLLQRGFSPAMIEERVKQSVSEFYTGKS